MNNDEKLYKEIIEEVEAAYPSGCEGSRLPGVVVEGSDSKAPVIMVGLNPAEAADDNEAFYNTNKFYIQPARYDSKSQRRWNNKLASLLVEDTTIIQSECLFHSSKNKAALQARLNKYSTKLEDTPHFAAACKINQDLFSKNKDAAVVFLGLSHKELFSKIVDLPELDYAWNGVNGKRLVEKYGKFYIIRHPSSHGFTADDKNKIKRILNGEEDYTKTKPTAKTDDRPANTNFSEILKSTDIKALIAKFGQETLMQARNILTINEFKLRFGLAA